MKETPYPGDNFDIKTHTFSDGTFCLIDLPVHRRFQTLYQDRTPIAAAAKAAIERGQYNQLDIADIALQTIGVGRKITFTSLHSPGRLITLFPGLVDFKGTAIHISPPPGTEFPSTEYLSSNGFFELPSEKGLFGAFRPRELQYKMHNTQIASKLLYPTVDVPQFHFITADQDGTEFGAYSMPDGVSPVKVITTLTNKIMENGSFSLESSILLEIGLHKLGYALRQLGAAGKIHGQPHLGNYYFPKGDRNAMIQGKLTLSDFETLQDISLLDIPKNLRLQYQNAAKLREADVACGRYSTHFARLKSDIQKGKKSIPFNGSLSTIFESLDLLEKRIKYSLFHGYSGLDIQDYMRVAKQNNALDYATLPVWQEMRFNPPMLHAFRKRMESHLRPEQS